MGLLQGIRRVFRPSIRSIAQLRPGQRATVRGTVVPRDLMSSPLTEERCVYYQYTIENWRRSRVAGVGGDGFWELSERDEAILEFYVQDDTARAIVSPARAQVERIRRIDLQAIDQGPNVKVRQLVIAPGDRIEVTALVERADDLYDEGRAYRVSPERVLLRAPPGGRIKIRLLARGAE